MTMQLTDPFIWNDEKWIFLCAEDVYSLFDPKEFDLSPITASTACWKGFVVKFRVDNNHLYLDELYVHCDNDNYPTINGVAPISDESIQCRMGMRLYKNLNILLSYSGIITIGKNLKSMFHGRAFIGPHAYKVTYELTFENGVLLDSKETSGTYSGF